MIDLILKEIETLDRQVDAISGEELEELSQLLESRTQMCVRLKQNLQSAGTQHLAGISTAIQATNRLRDRFTFLRNNAAEDLVLLHKQDQLINVLAPEPSEPAYVDYSV